MTTRLVGFVAALSLLGPAQTYAWSTDDPLDEVQTADDQPEVEAAIGPEVDQSAFTDALADFGNWVSSSFGNVWVPSASIVGAGFVPYGTGGQWQYTDLGWTWVSDYSWGWAPFHYGTWAQANDGWVWIPGSTWAPAWVSWVGGGGYVGWAPLGPGWAAPRSGAYVYVKQTQFADANLRDNFVPRSRLAGVRANVRALPSARAVRNYPVTPVNAGPRPTDISSASGRPVVPVATASRAVFPPVGQRGVHVPKGSSAESPFVTRRLQPTAARQFVSAQSQAAAASFRPSAVVKPWSLRTSGETHAFAPAPSQPHRGAASPGAPSTPTTHPNYQAPAMAQPSYQPSKTTEPTYRAANPGPTQPSYQPPLDANKAPITPQATHQAPSRIEEHPAPARQPSHETTYQAPREAPAPHETDHPPPRPAPAAPSKSDKKTNPY